MRKEEKVIIFYKSNYCAISTRIVKRLWIWQHQHHLSADWRPFPWNPHPRNGVRCHWSLFCQTVATHNRQDVALTLPWTETKTHLSKGWSPTGLPVAPLSFADSLRERQDLVSRHPARLAWARAMAGRPDYNPDHKRSGPKPYLSAVGVKRLLNGTDGMLSIGYIA